MADMVSEKNVALPSAKKIRVPNAINYFGDSILGIRALSIRPLSIRALSIRALSIRPLSIRPLSIGHSA